MAWVRSARAQQHIILTEFYRFPCPCVFRVDVGWACVRRIPYLNFDYLFYELIFQLFAIPAISIRFICSSSRQSQHFSLTKPHNFSIAFMHVNDKKFTNGFSIENKKKRSSERGVREGEKGR